MIPSANLTAQQASAAVDARYGGGVTKVNAHLYRVRCPVHGGGDRNLAIKDGGAALPLVECHSRGCDRRAIRLICGAAGLEPIVGRRKSTPRRRIPSGRTTLAQQQQNLDQILPLLHGVAGTPVQAYLEWRHLDLPPAGHALRYLAPRPPNYPWPTMVAVVTDFAEANRILSLQFTALASDGRGKAPVSVQRRFLGGHPVKGGCIRLTDDAEVTDRLGLAEGVETALAIMTSARRARRMSIAVWSALDAGNLGDLPVVDGVDTLVIYADRRRAGEDAAAKLAARWQEVATKEVYVSPAPTDDWNSP